LLGELRPQIGADALRRLHEPAYRVRAALVLEELPRGAPQQLLLVVEAEVHGLAFREAEHALAADVALDLGGAAFDRVGPRAQKGVLPEAVRDRPGAAVGELAERALDLHGQLLHALVALHPHHLARGGLGPWHLA